jgi:hypothetical protein
LAFCSFSIANTYLETSNITEIKRPVSGGKFSFPQPFVILYICVCVCVCVYIYIFIYMKNIYEMCSKVLAYCTNINTDCPLSSNCNLRLNIATRLNTCNSAQTTVSDDDMMSWLFIYAVHLVSDGGHYSGRTAQNWAVINDYIRSARRWKGSSRHGIRKYLPSVRLALTQHRTTRLPLHKVS